MVGAPLVCVSAACVGDFRHELRPVLTEGAERWTRSCPETVTHSVSHSGHARGRSPEWETGLRPAVELRGFEPLTSSMPWAGVASMVDAERRSFPYLQGVFVVLVAAGWVRFKTVVTRGSLPKSSHGGRRSGGLRTRPVPLLVTLLIRNCPRRELLSLAVEALRHETIICLSLLKGVRCSMAK
jgi:hypothetical protein